MFITGALGLCWTISYKMQQICSVICVIQNTSIEENQYFHMKIPDLVKLIILFVLEFPVARPFQTICCKM